MTASTVGLASGMHQALGIVTTGLAHISLHALNSKNKIIQGLGLIGVAATVASSAVNQLVTGMVALTGVVQLGSERFIALNNAEQTFGSHIGAITNAIKAQSDAFGHSRTELMAYAETVGRELHAAGVSVKTYAQIAEYVTRATSHLAASRQMSPEEAFRQIKSAAMLFTPDQIQGMAFQKGLIQAPTQQLTEGTRLMSEYYLAAQQVFDMTTDIAEATDSWNGHLNLLINSIREMAVSLGKDLAPGFIDITDWLTSVVKALDDTFTRYRELSAFIGAHFATGDVDQAFQAIVGLRESRKELPAAPGIDESIDAQGKENLRRSLLGQFLSGGGGGIGGYQGSFAGFHQKVQDAAWNQRQLAVLQKQSNTAEQMLSELQKLNAAGNQVGPKKVGN